MTTKHREYSRQMGGKIYGQADRLKLGKKAFEDEIAQAYMCGMIEMALGMVLEDKYQSFKDDELKGHIKFLYTKLINLWRVEFAKREYMMPATLELVGCKRYS